MKKTSRFALTCFYATAFATANLANANPDPDPNIYGKYAYLLTVSKTGPDGWTEQLAVGEIGSGSLKMSMNGKVIEARIQGASGGQTETITFKQHCALDGNPEIGSYSVGRVLAVVDDRVYVNEYKLVRMEKQPIGQCVGQMPIVHSSNWSAVVPVGSIQRRQEIPATIGYAAFVQPLRAN